MIRRVASVPLAGLAALVLAGSASGLPTPVQQAMSISYEIGHDGRGELIANLIPDGSGTYSWMRCAAGGSGCAPVAASDGNRVLDVGRAAPGTVFVATGTHGTTTSSARSLPYRGRVRTITAPRMTGKLRVGALARPVAARWVGGWGNDRNLLQLQVCHSRSGARCVVISDSVYENRYPGTGAILDPRYRGWFVRVVDQRIGRDTGFLLVAYSSGHVPLIAPGPDAASAIAGRISAR